MERGFSSGGLTVSKMRHNLSDESTRTATVVGSWATVPGLIPSEEIINKFKDKHRRPKQPLKGENVSTAIEIE